mmetsp:Transcript_56773/g.105067  ORF Transcript_56773/g.105067 Transcript_56773/m.105067 type:complete len:175 (-) Transcript_56773:42-566(-)
MWQDRGEVLARARQEWESLVLAPDSCKSDREIILAAVSKNGHALQCAAESCKSDREIVLTAMANRPWALQWASDDLLEDTSFAADFKKSNCYMVKVFMLSGQSCCIAATFSESTRDIIAQACERLGLKVEGSHVLLHETTVVPLEASVQDWPGIRTFGEVSSYQLVVGSQLPLS